ncbi:hypothetical protein U5801_21325 [Lamprobacter modestohalophilus]|uniref:hypothetical protein n=1 Tax=Lamprobacter modestohalophilus TaxID=1064514 RepID=UPI002ADEF837|nr:hypothetical protein [Lamprobacter modestohalophilus]MEA1052326.1 hypothetical protein [Lamprobacter modestohalophilus]
MSETLHRLEDLLPVEFDAEQLVRLAPVLWRERGLLAVSLGQIEGAEHRAALQTLAEALYGAPEAVARVRIGDGMVSADGARWEALSADGERLLARRLSDGALASVHQPRGSRS